MTQAHVERKPLGWWLLSEQVLDSTSLDAALEEQRLRGGKLGDVLVGSGRARKADVFRCLGLQCGLPFISLHGTPPEKNALAMLSADEARELHAIPMSIRLEGGKPVVRVAVGPPERRWLARRLEPRFGIKVEPALCDPDELVSALAFYDSLGVPMMRPVRDDTPTRDSDEPSWLGPPVESDPHIQALVDADLAEPDTAGDADVLVLEADEAGVVEDIADFPMNPPPVEEGPTVTADSSVRELAAQERIVALEEEVARLQTALGPTRELANRVAVLEALVEQLLARPHMPEPEPPAPASWPTLPIGPGDVDALFEGVRVADTPVDVVLPAPREVTIPSLPAVVLPVVPAADALAKAEPVAVETPPVAPPVPEPPRPPLCAAALCTDPDLSSRFPPPLPRRSPFAALLAEAELPRARPAADRSVDGADGE